MRNSTSSGGAWFMQRFHRVEIRLHDAPAIDGDRLAERRAQPIERRALRLIFGARQRPTNDSTITRLINIQPMCLPRLASALPTVP